MMDFRTKIFICLTKFLAYDKTLADAKNILERSSEGVWFYNAVVMKTLRFPESLHSQHHARGTYIFSTKRKNCWPAQ